MQLVIRNIQYHPNDGPVAVYIEHDSATPRFRDYVNLSQDDLTAHAGGVWSDADVLALVQERIAVMAAAEGIPYVVAFPTPPITVAQP